jgi:hypothetical protein
VTDVPATPDAMDEKTVETLARAAGLDVAWADFRDDVLHAARRARTLRGAISAPADPADEPWPAMHVGPR